MARGTLIEVQGLNKLKKKLGQIPENVKKMVDAEMSAIAKEYEDRAVAAAPVDTGFLKGQISASKVGEMNYEIVSGAKYSGYVEFGTVTKVQVPAELTTYAAQFKGAGLKKSGGMRAHPFFFLQLPIARADLNKNLKIVVNKALKGS